MVTPAFAPTNGMVMLSRRLQPANARSPMLVTLSGIVTLVSLLQPKKVRDEMPVTKSGTVNSVTVLSFTPVIVQDVTVEVKINGSKAGFILQSAKSVIAPMEPVRISVIGFVNSASRYQWKIYPSG